MPDQNERMPIKVVIPKDDDYFRPPPGGSPRKIFDNIDSDVIEYITAQINSIETHFESFFEKYPNAPAVAKVCLKKEALAKTHRPYSLLNTDTCPVIGVAGFGELLVSVQPKGLTHLGRKIHDQRSKSNIADLSTIQQIIPYSFDDVFSSEQGLSYLKKELKEHGLKVPLKLRLFRHINPILNHNLIEAFKDQLKELQLEYPEEIYYGKDLTIYKLHINNIDKMLSIANFSGTQKISYFPRYQFLKHQTIPIREPSDDDLPLPISGFNYSVVGVVDSGVDPKNTLLAPWIYDRLEFVPNEKRNYDHGSFVSGLIINSRSLNAMDDRFPEVSSKILDIVAIPKNGGISEDELLAILEEAIKRFPKVKVWNLSLSNPNSICSNDSFSDLAIALDRLQDENDVIFTIASGNYSNRPLRKWPPQNLGELDRICSPADSVRAVTVGSLAHLCRPNSCVLEEQPSPFSRRGPGPAFIPKPEIAHYGGNCDDNGNCTQTGIISFDKDGMIAENIGTSFSTPIVATLLSNLKDSLQKDASRNLLKALLIHSAVMGADKIDTDHLRYKGFGIPNNINYILSCRSWFATLVIEAEIMPGQILHKFPFPVPPCMRTSDGKVIGEMFMTLVYDPPLDPKFGSEYCRTNIDISLGTYSKDKKGKLRHKKQIPQEPRDLNKLYERYLIEHGFKWSPVKVYKRSMSRVSGDDWRLCISRNNRSEMDVIEPQKFALLITLMDRQMKRPVYDEVAVIMNRIGWIVEDLQIRDRMRIRTRG